MPLTKDLNLKAFKKIKTQNLTVVNMEKHLLKLKALKRRFTAPESKNILFSDDKPFAIDEKFNNQNIGYTQSTKRTSLRKKLELGDYHNQEVGIFQEDPIPHVFVSSGNKWRIF